MDSKNRQAHATEPSQVSRRSVAKGTAWAVPAITSMTLVPAFAASAQRKQVIITFDAKKHKETIQCVRIPAEATDIRYSIRGVSGRRRPQGQLGRTGRIRCRSTRPDPSARRGYGRRTGVHHLGCGRWLRAHGRMER